MVERKVRVKSFKALKEAVGETSSRLKIAPGYILFSLLDLDDLWGSSKHCCSKFQELVTSLPTALRKQGLTKKGSNPLYTAYCSDDDDDGVLGCESLSESQHGRSEVSTMLDMETEALCVHRSVFWNVWGFNWSWELSWLESAKAGLCTGFWQLTLIVHPCVALCRANMCGQRYHIWFHESSKKLQSWWSVRMRRRVWHSGRPEH